MVLLFDIAENTVGKGENAGYQQFLLFPQCFPKPSSLGSLKVKIVLYRVNYGQYLFKGKKYGGKRMKCWLPAFHLLLKHILTNLHPNSKLWTVWQKVQPFSKIILPNFTHIQDSNKYRKFGYCYYMKLCLYDWNSFTYICNTAIINITRIL